MRTTISMMVAIFRWCVVIALLAGTPVVQAKPKVANWKPKVENWHTCKVGAAGSFRIRTESTDSSDDGELTCKAIFDEPMEGEAESLLAANPKDHDKDHGKGQSFPCATVDDDDSFHLDGLWEPWGDFHEGGNKKKGRGLAAVAEHRTFLWPIHSKLRILFVGGDPVLNHRIESVAKQWTKFAGLTFDFVNHGPADIRIGFMKTKNHGDQIISAGSWSKVGTTANTVPQDEITMNFSWLTPDSSLTEIRRVVLHEFGHALGLGHEHQHPFGKIKWNTVKVIEYYKRTNGWGEDEINSNIMKKLKKSDSLSTEVDPRSIMLYSFPPELTLDGYSVAANTELSSGDKKFIAAIYPDVARLKEVEELRKTRRASFKDPSPAKARPYVQSGHVFTPVEIGRLWEENGGPTFMNDARLAVGAHKNVFSIYARDKGGNFWERELGRNLSGDHFSFISDWQELSYGIDFDPGIGSPGEGGVFYFGVIGNDGSGWLGTYIRDRLSWEDIGGAPFQSGPGVAYFNNRVFFMALGTGRSLWNKWKNPEGTWSAWEKLGAGFIYAPYVLASNKTEELYVFTVGVNHQVNYRVWRASDKSWSSWHELDGYVTSGVVALALPNGEIRLFARGTKNELVSKSYQKKSWTPWESLGGELMSGPAAVLDPSQRGIIHIFTKERPNVLRVWNSHFQGDE